MAGSSSSGTNEISLGSPSMELLTRNNFPLWRAQVMPDIRGAQLTGFLDGSEVEPSKTITVENPDKTKEPLKVTNPEYTSWLSKDQKLPSYLVKSLSKEILMHVLRMEHASEVWKAVESMFAAEYEQGHQPSHSAG
jgi:hypothetical protein